MARTVCTPLPDAIDIFTALRLRALPFAREGQGDTDVPSQTCLWLHWLVAAFMSRRCCTPQSDRLIHLFANPSKLSFQRDFYTRCSSGLMGFTDFIKPCASMSCACTARWLAIGFTQHLALTWHGASGERLKLWRCQWKLPLAAFGVSQNKSRMSPFFRSTR